MSRSLTTEERREISTNLIKEIDWQPIKDSRIASFYSAKCVLVTGATGFLGKLLVEKLLRGCPDLDMIYILVRPKKGQDEHVRVEKLYSEQIFMPLTKLNPKFRHKISIIKGDAALPNLGISAGDQNLIRDKINVIFHVAATVRFDEPLNIATAINVRSTRDLLNLAKKCKKLDAFIHVSTAYANCNQAEIDEIFYKIPMTAKHLIEMMENTKVKDFNALTSEVIKGWPNTYTFTKAVAEDAIISYGTDLPIAVVRPSIVVATYKEPLRSWIDNLYGATGIAVGAGTGLLKSIHCKGEKCAEIVPGDYVINCLIAASYKTAIDKKTKIYNCVSSVENRHSWFEYMSFNKYWGIPVPTTRCIWYYNFRINRYYYIHFLYTIFLHFLPALFMDLGMVLTQQKPIMWKIYKKIYKFESVIEHFSTKEWKFYNNNTQNLWKDLSEADQKTFPFSLKELDWEEYHKTHLLGLRIYLVKDDISTIPQALVKWQRFYIADYVLRLLLRAFLLYFVYLFISNVFVIKWFN